MKTEKKALMAVMNTLVTDARVQRAASALRDSFDLTVAGTAADEGEHGYRQLAVELHGRGGFLRWFSYERQIRRLLRGGGYDLFYGHDYYSASLIRWVRKKYPQIRTVYDAHELMIPEEGKRMSLRNRFFYLREKAALSSADLIVCASETRGEMMRQHYGLTEAPLVINNISELTVLDDEKARQYLEMIRPVTEQGKAVLVYAGVLAAGRRIGQLIGIVRDHPDTVLLIIGSGEDEENLKRQAEEQIPGRYCFTGNVPYKYLGTLLSRCGAAYISYPTNSLNNTYCAPNKIYEYASVGLPMIAPENPTLRLFFERDRVGEIGGRLEDAFAAVLRDLPAYRENCRRFTAEHPWSAEAEKLRAAVAKLME